MEVLFIEKVFSYRYIRAYVDQVTYKYARAYAETMTDIYTISDFHYLPTAFVHYESFSVIASVRTNIYITSISIESTYMAESMLQFYCVTMHNYTYIIADMTILCTKV